MLLLILLRFLFFVLFFTVLVGIGLKIAAWKVPAVRRWLHQFRVNPLEDDEERVQDAVEEHHQRHSIAEDIRSIDQEQDKADRDTISNFKP